MMISRLLCRLIGHRWHVLTPGAVVPVHAVMDDPAVRHAIYVLQSGGRVCGRCAEVRP
jgi:hypothetical protein